MILRINQIEPMAAEAGAGWGSADLRAAFDHAWSPRTQCYEVLILDHDERNQPLPANFRRAQFRQLLPRIIDALAEEEMHAVLRLDGPLLEQELLPALRYVGHWDRCPRFAVSPMAKFEAKPDPAIGSVRLLLGREARTALCHDDQVGLERSVRLRAVCVPEFLVNPVLDAGEVDDERWRDILAESLFVLSTTHGLASLLIWTAQLDVAETRRRILAQLGR